MTRKYSVRQVTKKFNFCENFPHNECKRRRSFSVRRLDSVEEFLKTIVSVVSFSGQDRPLTDDAR